MTYREDCNDRMADGTFVSLVNRATMSCNALQSEDKSQRKISNIEASCANSIFECGFGIPTKYQIREIVPQNFDIFKALVYALRFVSNPFFVYGCDYPPIGDELLECDRENGLHLPFIVMHSRAKRKNTASNQKS